MSHLVSSNLRMSFVLLCGRCGYDTKKSKIFGSVPFDEIIHLLFTFIANLRFNSRAISSHIFRTSLLTSSCFLYFTAEPSAYLDLVGLSHHTCRTIGSIKQNSAGLRLRSKIGPANVGWEWRSMGIISAHNKNENAHTCWKLAGEC